MPALRRLGQTPVSRHAAVKFRENSRKNNGLVLWGGQFSLPRGQLGHEFHSLIGRQLSIIRPVYTEGGYLMTAGRGPGRHRERCFNRTSFRECRR